MGSFPETYIVPEVFGLLGLYLAITIKLQNCGNFIFSKILREDIYSSIFLFLFLCFCF